MHVKSDWGRKGGGKTCGKGIPVQITRRTKSLRSRRVSANDAKSCGMRSQRRPEKNSVFYKLFPEPPLPAVDHHPPFLLFPSSKTKASPQTCSSLFNFAVTELFHRFNPTFFHFFSESLKFGLPDRQAGARNRGSLGLSSGENSRVLGRSARFLPGVGFPVRAGTEQDARAQVPRPRWRGRASAKAAVGGRGGALNSSSGFRKSYF